MFNAQINKTLENIYIYIYMICVKNSLAKRKAAKPDIKVLCNSIK